MGESGSQRFSNRISLAVQGYPFNRRVLSAVSACVVLLVVTLNWKFEPAKTIAVCAVSVACLFDRKGKWFWFSWGIGIGDLLLYLSR